MLSKVSGFVEKSRDCMKTVKVSLFLVANSINVITDIFSLLLLAYESISLESIASAVNVEVGFNLRISPLLEE